MSEESSIPNSEPETNNVAADIVNRKVDRNRRLQIRRGGKGKVTWWVGVTGLGRPIAGKVLDVCVDGIQFLAPVGVVKGATIEIDLSGVVGRTGRKVFAKVIRVQAETEQFQIAARFQSRVSATDLVGVLR